MSINANLEANIHSFIPFILDIPITPLQVHYYSEALPTQQDAVSEFHAEALQAIASEGLAQRRYVAARTGFEPMTLRSTGINSTNEPPTPHNMCPVVRFLSSFAHLC